MKEYPENLQSLWAPWRADYVKGIDNPKADGCFLCSAARVGEEREKLVLCRGEAAFVMANRYPYNPGHLMVVCNVHAGELESIEDCTVAEMWSLLVKAKKALAKFMQPQGFNIGINQGRCAGAGVVDHLHIHIVPRWNGDCNFMPVTAGTRILSQSLEDLYDQLLPEFQGSV